MIKLKMSFLLSLSLVGMCLTGCNGIGNGKEIYILPTNFGVRCLRDNQEEDLHTKKKPYLLNSYQDSDGSYRMNVSSTALKNEYGDSIHFNETGTNFESNDLDVLLFGIGTNLDNSSDARTLLYSSFDENGSSNSGIVTGVEYAYGTGPIKKDVFNLQHFWLKTTAMVRNGGVYIADKDIDVKYTSVYLQLLDKDAPVLNDDYEEEIAYSHYANLRKKDSFESYLKDTIAKNASYVDRGLLDEEYWPWVKDFSVDGGLKDEYFHGDSITGTFDLSDPFENVSETRKFRFDIVKDWDDKIELPYTKTIKKGPEQTLEFIKEKVASSFTEVLWGGNALSVDDVDIDNETFVELFQTDLSMDNLHRNILEKRMFEISVSLTKGGYKFSTESDVFLYKMQIIDDRPVNRSDVEFIDEDAYLNLNGIYLDVDSFQKEISDLFKNIKYVNDDFEDEYSGFIYIKGGGSDEDYLASCHVIDSTTLAKFRSDGVPRFGYNFGKIYRFVLRGDVFKEGNILCDFRTGSFLENLPFSITD